MSNIVLLSRIAETCPSFCDVPRYALLSVISKPCTETLVWGPGLEGACTAERRRRTGTGNEAHPHRACQMSHRGDLVKPIFPRWTRLRHSKPLARPRVHRLNR